MDNGPIFPITLIQGSGVFLPFTGEKGIFFLNRIEVNYV